MTDEVSTDQAPEQSVTDRIAAKFGLSTAPEQEEAPVESVEADLAEIELGEKKYRVPKELQDAFMKNQDYTQKTQQLAEERKRIDHVRTLAEQAQASQAFTQAVQAEQQELAVIEAYLTQASKTDWSQMSMEAMVRTKHEIDMVKERRDSLKAVISEKRTKFETDLKDRLTDLRVKAREMASKSISGFSEETEKTVRAYAQSEGLADPEIDNVLLDPRSFKILWKAAQFEKVQANVGKATATAEKVMKPGAASERMPQQVKDKLNLRKELKASKSSGDKARSIESYLAAKFGG